MLFAVTFGPLTCECKKCTFLPSPGHFLSKYDHFLSVRGTRQSGVLCQKKTKLPVNTRKLPVWTHFRRMGKNRVECSGISWSAVLWCAWELWFDAHESRTGERLTVQCEQTCQCNVIRICQCNVNDRQCDRTPQVKWSKTSRALSGADSAVIRVTSGAGDTVSHMPLLQYVLFSATLQCNASMQCQFNILPGRCMPMEQNATSINC